MPYNHVSRLTKRWEQLTIKCLLATSKPRIAFTKQNFPFEKKNPELLHKIAMHPLLHSAINKKTLFGSKLDLNLRGGGGLVKCYICSIILHGAKKNLDISESRWETPGKFWSVVLEKDREDQLHRLYEKWGSITDSPGEEYPTHNKKKKTNWIGQIMRRNCLLKHAI
jgi:hypothetical protein